MNAALCVNRAHTLGDYFLFWGRLVLNQGKKVKDEKVAFAMSVESEVTIIGSTMFQSWTWLGGCADESLATEEPSTLIR